MKKLLRAVNITRGPGVWRGTVAFGICAIPFDVFAIAGDAWSRRPIHIVCSESPEAVVGYVVHDIVDCDAEDCLGCSTLYYTSRPGNESIVQLLLEGDAQLLPNYFPTTAPTLVLEIIMTKHRRRGPL